MSKIHAAYQKLGAHPGADFESMKRRYKVLVLVWHPDRMTTDAGRQIAEEELKQINNAFECIKKHFESAHRQGLGCECQPAAAAAHNQQTGSGQNQHASYGAQGGSSQTYSNPGGSQRQKTVYEQWAEQEARAEADRRRRAEEAHETAMKEALEKARQAAEAQAATAAASAKAKAAINQPLTEEQLRWRISMVLAAIFVFLLIGGFNRRYEPSSRPNSEFSVSTVGHLRPCSF